MADGERLGASFSIDITQLKAGLQQANRLIKESNSEFKAAAAGLDDWTNSEAGLTAKLKNLNDVSDIQAKKVEALQKEYDRCIADGLDPMSAAAVKMRTDINNQKAALENTKAETQKYQKALDDLQTEADQAGDELEDLSEKAKNTSGGFTVMKGALADLISNGIQAAVGAIKGLVGEAISASDSLYKFEQTMGFAGYDSKTIEKAKADMKDYADKTVYDLDTMANMTAQLAANGIKDFTGLTQAAGNLNAVAGGNADTFNSFGLVLTQTAGAGKLTTENWNQLANAIPGASGKLQEALLNAGAYTGNFRDAMANGEITADEFNAAIMELGNEPVAVEAATSVDTFEGAVGNMQATVVDGLMQIIDAIGMENITGFISKATDGISEVIGLIPEIKDGFTSSFGWLKDNLPIVATTLGGITAAMIAFKGATIASKVATVALSTATKIQTGVQAALNAVMSANPIGLIILAITALVAAFMILWKKCDGFREFWQNLWAGIKNVISAVVGWIKENWKTMILFLMNPIAGLFKYFYDHFEGFRNVVDGIGKFFQNVFKTAISKIKGFFSGLGSFFGNFWQTIKNKFSSLGSAIGSAISGAVKSAINSVMALIETRINSAIGLINSVIDGINKINPLKDIGHVKTLSLPRLAKGGVVSQATTAVIGEDGKEAVVPLERNLEWIDKVADKVAEKIGNVGGGVIVNQTNNYSQAHSRYELYKSKQQTAAAVRLAMQGG